MLIFVCQWTKENKGDITRSGSSEAVSEYVQSRSVGNAFADIAMEVLDSEKSNSGESWKQTLCLSQDDSSSAP